MIRDEMIRNEIVNTMISKYGMSHPLIVTFCTVAEDKACPLSVLADMYITFSMYLDMEMEEDY